MTHRRMKWLIISELALVLVLLILALAVPSSRPLILPIVLLAGVVQTLAVTWGKEKRTR